MATVYTSWSSSFTPSGASQARRFRGGLIYYSTNNTATSITYVVNPGVQMDYPMNSTFDVTGSATGVSSVTHNLECSYSYDIDEAWFGGHDWELTPTYTKTHSTQTKTFTVSVKGKSVPAGSGWGSTTLTKSVTVTIPAKTSYTVTYNLDGGSGSIESQTKWHGETLTLSSTKPTKAGYIFKGWTGSNGTTYQPGGTVAADVNISLTLTAIWHQMPSMTSRATSREPYYYPIDSYSVEVSNTVTHDDATISSIVLTVGSQTASRTDEGSLSITFNASGTFEPKVVLTDSQGGSVFHYYPKITVNAYTLPSVSYSLDRTDSTGAHDDVGTYALISAVFNYTDALALLDEPEVTVTDENNNTTSPTVTWYTTTMSYPITSWPIAPESPFAVYGLVAGSFGTGSYQISVIPKDRHDNQQGTGTAITQILPSAFFTMDFLAGGHGIALGRPSTQQGFFCDMDAHFADKTKVMRALFDFVYPVGSYYETSDASFDPNVTWGGTWSLEASGQVHVSAGTGYTIGATGGSATVTLDTTMIPAHTHGNKSISGSFAIRKYGNNYNMVSGVSGICTSADTTGTGYATDTISSLYALQEVKIDASHEHTSVGGGQAHNNMQPYIVVNRWHRTA